MNKIKISKDKLRKLSYKITSQPDFPLYTTFLMNQASSTAQATRAEIVGQMSDLVPEFLKTDNEKSIAGWEKWYKEKKPNAVKDATKKVTGMLSNFEKALSQIDKKMVETWVEDLLITKTYVGLISQQVILQYFSSHFCQEYRLATPEEEGRGIDGFIGKVPISIKPLSYKKQKKQLNETIDVTIIFYEKNRNNGLDIEFDEEEIRKKL